MKKTHFITLFCILFLFKLTYCQLFVFTNNYPTRQYGYIDSIHGYGYKTVYVNDYQIGSITLKSSSINIKAYGSYLDIIETATMSIAMTDQSMDYYIGGILSLPTKSSISSLFISDGKNEYCAKILDAFSNNSKDTTLGNAVAILSLENRGGPNVVVDQYRMRLFNTIPGKEYTVKIRYLCPNTGDANSSYTLGPLFLSNTKNPSNMEINYSSAKDERKYLFSASALKYQLTDGMSLQLQFQNQFIITPIDQIASQFHITEFADGAWKGNYLLLNTSISDSVKTLFGKPIETIVLWRWNKPSSFVIKYSYYDNKYLTGYGNQAVTQAKAIEDLANELSNTGNKTGLVHSIPNKAPVVFPLCKRGSMDYAKLESYLDQFTVDYFINSGYFETDIKSDNPSDTLSDSSKFEFLKSMRIINGLYSNGKGIMKHLIILSCGPVPISRNLVTLEELDTLFSNISVDKSNAVWRDVNFSLIENIAEKRNFISVGNFKMPEYKPTSVLLNVSTLTKNYNFPLSPDQPSFSIVAKSENTWNPQLTWSGFDASGNLIRTVVTTANIYSTTNDTGLVKLWAFNNDRLSDSKETDLGYKYGVISEENKMKIYPSFLGYDSTATAFATSLDYYTCDTNDISTAVKKSILSGTQAFRCTYCAGLLSITLPNNKLIKRIRIYSLSGKLITEFDPMQFKTTNGYVIRVSQLKKNFSFAAGMVLIRIDGDDLKIAQQILLK